MSGASRSTARSPRRVSWPWDEFVALPAETITVDIHCVTKWTKLDTTGGACRSTRCSRRSNRGRGYVTACRDGGYTTNLPLADVSGGKAWVAYDYGGEPLEPEHGGPARLLVPASVFLEERQVGARPDAHHRRRAGLLGGLRLPQPRRPMAGAALPGRLTWQLGDGRRAGPRDRTRQEHRPGGARLAGHRAGQHVDVRLTAEDGYQAQRSYSIASAPGGPRVSDRRAAGGR